jgi:NADH dehydrogenase [ubiquinone] 1 alpha subcomplex assembly factor 3
MDIYNSSNTPQPATYIDATTTDGFHLNNGVKTSDGKGILLFGGEAFGWDPTAATANATSSSSGDKLSFSVLLDARGTLSIPPTAFALLELYHPKPDLLLIGTGAKLWMLSKQTREYLNSVLGVRVDVMDTANASAAYNLLAQERGVEGGGGVGAAMLPLGWKGPGKA